MRNTFILIVTVLLLGSSVSFGEVISRILTYNGPGNQLDQCNAICQDKNGKVYATGVSWGGTSKEDFATIKFGEDGDFLWVARYNGSGNNLDHASAITVDNNGNVYVTGWSRSSSSYGSEDYMTIKYNANGVQQWAMRYDGAVSECDYYDYARAIAVDAAGNVYITGQSWGNDDLRDDYLTVKYNANGVLQWAKRYNGPSSKEDIVSSLHVDFFGNVYVTGGSYMNSKGYDMLTVKYNSSGSQQWTVRYDGPAFLDDKASKIKVDQAGNVYITGSSHGGSSAKLDYVTIKYNPAGQQQWLKRYNGTANDTDAATSMDLDVHFNVYVSGYSKSTGSAGYDYTTIKYSHLDGAVMWQKNYNGNGLDKAWDISISNNACVQSGPENDIPCYIVDVYVTGQSVGTGTSNDFVTVHYDENGNQKWANRFNGPANGSDIAYSVGTFDNRPIVYAGGSFSSDYGIIGISEVAGFDNANFNGGFSTSYPNPFNPETNITFNVAKESNVKITVYDILGRTVALLTDKKYTAGIHSVSFNAVGLNSGVYFYRYESDLGAETKKLVLIK